MVKSQSVEQVAEQMLESIMATPKRQRRLYSKTFWHQFGFKVRSKERVEKVWNALRERGVVISVADGEFGSEDKKDWIVLSFLEPHPRDEYEGNGHYHSPNPEPNAEWFDLISGRQFTSEREVEYFFAIPLLQELGFSPEQCAVGFRVKMCEGVRRVEKEADMVVFADDTKKDAIIVVEAKRVGRPLTEDVAGQTKAYTLWLRAPYYLLTNGDDVRIFHFHGPWHADVLLLAFSRSELKEKWSKLYRCLDPETVIEFKERLREQMQVSAVA
jgi:hypothetical protein